MYSNSQKILRLYTINSAIQILAIQINLRNISKTYTYIPKLTRPLCQDAKVISSRYIHVFLVYLILYNIRMRISLDNVYMHLAYSSRYPTCDMIQSSQNRQWRRFGENSALNHKQFGKRQYRACFSFNLFPGQYAHKSCADDVY